MFRFPWWVFAAAVLGCAHAQIQPAPSSVKAETSPGAAAQAPPLPAEAQSADKPCALPSLAEAASPELVTQVGTGLERYQLEGGAWLPNAPVLVNEDFDFAVALAMGPVGAGLAAGKRKEANEHKTAALADTTLSADTTARLDALRAEGVHAYFVLWGREHATLQLVVERNVGCAQKAAMQVHAGAQRELAEWGEPEVLDREARGLLEQRTESGL